MTTYGPNFNGVVRSVPDRSPAEPENQADALDREAVKKAQVAYNETLNNDGLGDAEYVIRAYLASLPEAPAVPVVKAVDGEIDRLRKALIAAGRHVGAGLADDVSTDFLMLVPEEVRLVMERHRASLASQHAVEGEVVAGLCPRCAGSGREPNARDLQCSKCLGAGAVVISTPAAADAGVREALRNVIMAWEATKPGNTTTREIQRWLVEDMKPAVDAARAALSLAAKRGQDNG